MNTTSASPIVVIIVGLLILWLGFKFIKGIIRLVLTIVVIGVIAYVLLNYLR